MVECIYTLSPLLSSGRKTHLRKIESCAVLISVLLGCSAMHRRVEMVASGCGYGEKGVAIGAKV